MMNTQVKGNIEIKEYNDKYLEAIKGLSWEEDFVKEDILECLKQWSECSVVIEEEGIVVAVELKEQGKGYGKALISYGVNQILDKGEERVTLWAVEGNPAKELYKKLGFEVIRLHEFVEKKLV